MKPIRSLGAGLAALALASCGPNQVAEPHLSRIPEGPWGGAGVVMTVTPQGAEVEFDCGHGAITQAPVTDDGRFDLPGRYVQERGGPISPDALPSRAARFRGTVQGDDLTLRLEVEELGAVGPFQLRRGAPARLVKCY
jgi:hypothetical protein